MFAIILLITILSEFSGIFPVTSILTYKSGLKKLSKNQLSFTLNELGTWSSDGLVGSFNVLALYTWEYVPSEFLTVAEFSSKPAKDFTLLFNL